MKARIQIALMGCLGSVGLHLYLTMHWYPLRFGFSTGESICNLNSTFSCGSVVASNFSALFGMPLALWGAVTNGVLFLMILLSWLEWSENPERLRRWTLLLAGMSVAASVVMGTISILFMENYCIFCLGAYVLSLVIFFAYKGLLKEPFFMHLKRDVAALWPESKGIITAFVSIPLMVMLVHRSFMNNMGDEKIEQMVVESVGDWLASPKQDFVAKPSLAMGPSSELAAVTLVEFADFRCGHCKRASYTLDAFVKAHPDVRFEFYSYPLDQACNEKMPGPPNGISCRLASAVLCAEKESKGWEMHHELFEMQDDFHKPTNTTELDPLLAKAVSKIGLNWERMQTCLADPAITDSIRSQAKQGGLVDVKGTPTLFANGRLLTRGQMVPVLQAVRQRALETKGITLPLPQKNENLSPRNN